MFVLPHDRALRQETSGGGWSKEKTRERRADSRERCEEERRERRADSRERDK
jgi:hypothetical protein